MKTINQKIEWIKKLNRMLSEHVNKINELKLSADDCKKIEKNLHNALTEITFLEIFRKKIDN